jgi:hypothetical protein
VGKIGASVSLLAGAAGAATAGYLLLAGAPARTITAYECQINGRSDAIVNVVTGSPLVDCAAAWPSATGGRSSAPPLTGWVTTSRRRAALVRPTVLGRPAPGWRRLPAGWTVRLPLVVLSDQLDDVAQPFNRGCSRAAADEHAVQAILTADHLDGWTVSVSARGSSPTACVHTIPVIEPRSRTVQLQRLALPTVAPPAARQRHELGSTERTQQRLAALQRRVNATLDRGCATVAAAAALWQRTARTAGFTPATLDYWRALNAGDGHDAGRGVHYTLYRQPASQDTGRCAHVLVSGSSVATVYAARLTP